MNKEELIKQGLTDEQASKVMSMYKEALKGQVPQSRLDEVVKERNELREKTAQQLEALSKSNGDVDGLKAQIAKMQEDNEKAIKAANEKYQALQLDTAISKMAADSGAYDVKALKAYLDVTEAKPDSDGVYRTIQTQIDALKADTRQSHSSLNRANHQSQLHRRSRGQISRMVLASRMRISAIRSVGEMPSRKVIPQKRLLSRVKRLLRVCSFKLERKDD